MDDAGRLDFYRERRPGQASAICNPCFYRSRWACSGQHRIGAEDRSPSAFLLGGRPPGGQGSAQATGSLGPYEAPKGTKRKVTSAKRQFCAPLTCTTTRRNAAGGLRLRRLTTACMARLLGPCTGCTGSSMGAGDKGATRLCTRARACRAEGKKLQTPRTPLPARAPRDARTGEEGPEL